MCFENFEEGLGTSKWTALLGVVNLLAHFWDELDAKKCVALRQKGACLDRLRVWVASGAAYPS